MNEPDDYEPSDDTLADCEQEPSYDREPMDEYEQWYAGGNG